MVDVGLLDPEMPTEEIALTWKLQSRFYDVRHDPRAVVAMQFPENFKGLYLEDRAVRAPRGDRRGGSLLSTRGADHPPAIAGRITRVSESATPVSRPSSTRTSSSLR
jgi:hypothetical protein